MPGGPRWGREHREGAGELGWRGMHGVSRAVPGPGAGAGGPGAVQETPGQYRRRGAGGKAERGGERRAEHVGWGRTGAAPRARDAGGGRERGGAAGSGAGPCSPRRPPSAPPPRREPSCCGGSGGRCRRPAWWPPGSWWPAWPRSVSVPRVVSCVVPQPPPPHPPGRPGLREQLRSPPGHTGWDVTSSVGAGGSWGEGCHRTAGHGSWGQMARARLVTILS